MTQKTIKTRIFKTYNNKEGVTKIMTIKEKIQARLKLLALNIIYVFDGGYDNVFGLWSDEKTLLIQTHEYHSWSHICEHLQDKIKS